MEFRFSEESEEWGLLKVRYNIIEDVKFGISGILLICGEEEETKSPCIFFTREEATQWCRWLAENKILPSTLNDVLSNELYVY